MFGFLIGALSLYGLVKVLRHGRCGHRGFRGGRHRGRHGGPGNKLRFLFERLDTSPGQEKAIRQAVRDVMDEFQNFGGSFGEAKGAARDVLTSEVFDEGPIDALFEDQDARLARLRVSLKEGLRTVHESLDDEQRSELGRLLRRFGGRFGGDSGGHHVFVGPYR